MRRLRIPNPNLLQNEKTFIDSDYISGSTIIVVSSFTFASNDMVVAGETGDKKTELGYLQGLTPPANISLLNPFNFNHNKGTILYRTDWDYVAIEGTAPNSTLFNQLVKIPIQWDKRQTIYIHTAGTDFWNYRIRFYNSVLGIYSEYSPTVPGAGFERNDVGQMIINVRRKIRDINRDRYSDSDIIQLLDSAQLDAMSYIPKLWFLYKDTWETATPNGFGNLINIGNGIAGVTNQTKYSLAQYNDLNYLDKLRYYYNNNGAFLLWDVQPLAAVDFDRFLYNQNRIKNDIILSFKLLPPDSNSAQGYVEVDPVPLGQSVGTFYPVYWAFPNTLSNIEDATLFPFPQLLEDYAAWRLHDWMGNMEEAAKYKQLYGSPPDNNPDAPLQGGLLMLQRQQNAVRRANGYGRSFWNFRGKRGTGNFFGKGIVSRDFYKENYF